MEDPKDAKEIQKDETFSGSQALSDRKYDLDLILDIPLQVRAELGTVKMLVNDLLQLGQGSIIELEKSVNDLLDIYVSDKLVAKGEVVVVDEKFGIRVTDIISPTERVKSLG